MRQFVKYPISTLYYTALDWAGLLYGNVLEYMTNMTGSFHTIDQVVSDSPISVAHVPEERCWKDTPIEEEDACRESGENRESGRTKFDCKIKKLHLTITKTSPFTVTDVSDGWLAECGMSLNDVLGSSWPVPFQGPCSDPVVTKDLLTTILNTGSGHAVIVFYVREVYRPKHYEPKFPTLQHHERLGLCPQVSFCPWISRGSPVIHTVPKAFAVDFQTVAEPANLNSGRTSGSCNQSRSSCTHVTLDLSEVKFGDAERFSIAARERVGRVPTTIFSADSNSWWKEGSTAATAAVASVRNVFSPPSPSQSSAVGSARNVHGTQSPSHSDSKFPWIEIHSDSESDGEDDIAQWGQFVDLEAEW